MNELVKAIKNFIVRDIIYIIGGTSVIVSFLYLHGQLKMIISTNTQTAVYFFVAGLSYPIGYCIQEIASITRIVTTASYFDPWPILTRVYRRFTHEPWKDPYKKLGERENIVNKVKEDELRIQRYASERQMAEIERTISFMQLGTTLGPCGIVSSALILIRAICRNCCFDMWLFRTTLIISVFLITMGWLKALQLIRQKHDLAESL